MCHKDIFHIIFKNLSFAFSHLWIHNLDFIVVCGVRDFHFIFPSWKKIVQQHHYSNDLLHESCVEQMKFPCIPGSMSELSRLFTYLEADNQNSHFSTTTHWQCGQLDYVFQGPLVEKIMTRFLDIMCAGWVVWWSKGGWCDALGVLQKRHTLWASLRSLSDVNPWGTAKKPQLCKESLPECCGHFSNKDAVYSLHLFPKCIFKFPHFSLTVSYRCFYLYILIVCCMSLCLKWSVSLLLEGQSEFAIFLSVRLILKILSLILRLSLLRLEQICIHTIEKK